MFLKSIVLRFFRFFSFYHQVKSIFHHPLKRVLEPDYLISFNSEETEFLRLCALSFNFQPDYSLGFRQKALYLVSLENVIFLGNSGALVQNGRVIQESTLDGLRLTKSPAFRLPAWMKSRPRPTGTFTSILHLPWAETSNYHWFVDCLPRLVLLLKEVKEPVKLIVAEKMPAFQRETLQFVLAGHSNWTLVSIPKTEKWEIKAFIFPSFVATHNSGFLPISLAQQIREKIWEGYQVAAGPAKRLYISRAGASKRRVTNEAAVIRVLQQFDFEVVEAETLTYRQQVQLFLNASLVVAPHGAGLTNILFSRHCTVLELHPADQVKSHYFMLSRALSLEYHYLIGSPAGDNLDFWVDENILNLKIAGILGAGSLK